MIYATAPTPPHPSIAAKRTSLDTQPISDDLSDEDTDSLFDEPRSPRPIAQLTPPPIPGLFFLPEIISPQLASSLFDDCLRTYFGDSDANQVMLFGLASSPSYSANNTGLPSFLQDLLAELELSLLPLLPPETHSLLFKNTGARQAIINLYEPSEGITPHVDLVSRFGDGILGVSLGSGCVMRFARADAETSTSSSRSLPSRNLYGGGVYHDLYLPPGSALVLNGEARYGWTHEIEGRTEDWVRIEGEGEGREAEERKRGLRISVTFRWLLPGADVVGEGGEGGGALGV